MAKFYLTDLKTEYLTQPLGLDIEQPRISWKLAAGEDVQDLFQAAYRITAGTAQGAVDCWDTGWVESSRSTGVKWDGVPLQPKTRYWYTVTVRNTDGEEASASDWLETGFLNPAQSAWGGAEWIGAPERYLAAKTMGVFVLSSTITVAEGGRKAGIIFGAQDPRLLDPRKNVYQIAGDNEIRFVLNVEPDPAVIEIFRIGYAPEDTEEKPFAVVPAVELETGKPVITHENRYQPHELKIEIPGNGSFTYLDGKRIDAIEVPIPFAPGLTNTSPRQLNPLGDNDITTFPRLNSIGYWVEQGSAAEFTPLTVSNYRTPKAVVTQIEGGSFVAEKGDIHILKDPSAHSIPMLRRDFMVGKQVRQARLYITARGIYDCAVNGSPVTDSWLNPGHTQYNKRIVYQTYDITGLLQEGKNGIGITLASGWWSDAQTFVLKNYNYYGDQEAVLARVEITYEDGSAEAFVTNTADWDYYGEGPVTYAGFFQGQHEDGRRREIAESFSKAGFTVDGMKKPAVITPAAIEAYSSFPGGFGDPWPELDHSAAKLVGSYHAPVHEITRLTAKSMTSPRPGMYLYDLEQEIAGVPYLKLKGRAGTEVVIRYGEILYPDLPEYQGLEGTMLTVNYRDAESTDRYILRGDPDGEIFCPRYTFHGYRYIEITGLEEPPALEDVQSIQLSSVDVTGVLETDSPLVNRLIENVKWSQLCNFISIPTDCPQRNERMGWAGDAHAFAHTATYRSDARVFYYRYLEALRDLQAENGKLPAIAPAGGGFGGITYEVAMICIVWELYQQYGDREVVEEYYPAIVKWFGYAQTKGLPGIGFMDSLPDWLAQEDTDPCLMYNAFYGNAARLIGRMAEIQGMEEDAAAYNRIYEEVKQYWNEHFVDPDTGMTRGLDGKLCDTQTSYALPIAYRMVSEEHLPAFYEHLNRRTLENGTRVMTGFFGTGVLNPSLTEGGHLDTACSLLKQTAFPSWLYPVTQGATTIWERWNSYTIENGFGGNNSMNSFNHYSLGSVLSWIYEALGGIQRDELHPGFERFTLAPAFAGFGRVNSAIDTPYGRIVSRWEKTENTVSYFCTVPANTRAELRLSDGTVKELGSGSYHFDITL